MDLHFRDQGLLHFAVALPTIGVLLRFMLISHLHLDDCFLAVAKLLLQRSNPLLIFKIYLHSLGQRLAKLNFKVEVSRSN